VNMRSRAFWLCSYCILVVVPQVGCGSSTANTPRLEALGTYSANMDLSCCRTECSLYIPLWVQIPPSRAIYRDPTLGVKIERVEADGREIRAWDILRNQDWGDLAVPIRVDQESFIYQLEADPWNYQRSGDENKRPKKEKKGRYLIPGSKRVRSVCGRTSSSGVAAADHGRAPSRLGLLASIVRRKGHQVC
jgi:hypothetical protein